MEDLIGSKAKDLYSSHRESSKNLKKVRHGNRDNQALIQAQNEYYGDLGRATEHYAANREEYIEKAHEEMRKRDEQIKEIDDILALTANMKNPENYLISEIIENTERFPNLSSTQIAVHLINSGEAGARAVLRGLAGLDTPDFSQIFKAVLRSGNGGIADFLERIDAVVSSREKYETVWGILDNESIEMLEDLQYWDG